MGFLPKRLQFIDIFKITLYKRVMLMGNKYKKEEKKKLCLHNTWN